MKARSVLFRALSFKAVMSTIAFVVFMGAHATSPSFALPGAEQKVAVSMGDSFIAGEAGRWKGNSIAVTGDFDGTDRAAKSNRFGMTEYKPEIVYGNTVNPTRDQPTGDGCHRSDVAPIKGVERVESFVLKPVNIACSGAKTANILTEPFKGEKPQIEQLAQEAQENDVKLIVVSIGGNNLGFSEIVKGCTALWVVRIILDEDHTCQGLNKTRLDRIDNVMESVVEVITEVKATMGKLKYELYEDYRLVLQSNPSPIPDGDSIRVDDLHVKRVLAGCPFRNVDLTWAHNNIVREISGRMETVATSENIDFLNLVDALAGHEVCAKGVHRASNKFAATNSKEMEWMRFVTFGIPNTLIAFGSQGSKTESLHPNFYGQLAMQDCIKQLWKEISKVGEKDPIVASCESNEDDPDKQRIQFTPLKSKIESKM